MDPRLTPARPDLADIGLKGLVEASRFVAASAARVRTPKTVLNRAPDHASSPDTELLFGEEVAVYEIAEGWAWVQAGLDGYVGYVPAQNLSASISAADHRVATLAAQIYAAPELKVPPVGRLPFGSRLTVTERKDGYAMVAPDRWIALAQLARLEDETEDWVAVAEMFLGVPYVWGGRSSWGLDCSALVQLARQAGGHDCPRDSDMQVADLGADIPRDAPLQRGDLIFWKGHVGIMRDSRLLLHANAHHMAVASEPLAGALERIEQAGDGSEIRRARLDGGALAS